MQPTFSPLCAVAANTAPSLNIYSQLKYILMSNSNSSAAIEQNGLLVDATRPFTSEMIMEAERLQANCHYFVAELMKQKKDIDYDAAQSIWLFKKLAEFEVRITRLTQTVNGIR